MRITATRDVSSLSFPLPLFESIAIADVEHDGERFSIVAGLTETEVAQIKTYALDESDAQLAMTSDRKRFGEGEYQTWYRKERTPFALVHNKSGTVAALAWFGPKPLGRKSMKYLSAEEQQQDETTLESGNWHTISYRSYGDFRGKGLMKGFLNYVMDVYSSVIPEVQIWAIVDINNPASAALARKIGFEKSEEHSDDDHIVMIRR